MIKINGKPIPQGAVDFELNRLIQFYVQHGMSQEQIRDQLSILKERAIEQAIGAKLLLDEATRLDIPVPEEEIDKKIEEMKKQAQGEANFMELLKKRGTNLVELRNQVKMGKKIDKLIEQVTSGVPEPTESEMEAHFNEHLTEYSKSEQALAQHILISVKSDGADDKLAAIAKIRDIRKRIEGGADFASEAAAHSDCPSGKKTGGSLGWFGRGAMVKPFDDAVFSLPVGGLSDIIETQFGYHIIYKNDFESAATPEFNEVRDQVLDFMRHTKRGDLLTAFVDELRAKVDIEIS